MGHLAAGGVRRWRGAEWMQAPNLLVNERGFCYHFPPYCAGVGGAGARPPSAAARGGAGQPPLLWLPASVGSRQHTALQHLAREWARHPSPTVAPAMLPTALCCVHCVQEEGRRPSTLTLRWRHRGTGGRSSASCPMPPQALASRLGHDQQASGSGGRQQLHLLLALLHAHGNCSALFVKCLTACLLARSLATPSASVCVLCRWRRWRRRP